MSLQRIIQSSTLANYGAAIRAAPREVIFNRNLILSTLLYAMSAVPVTWDQGAASVIPSLPGFQHQFSISSGTDAGAIKNFIALVYPGYAVGAAGSFLTNDRLGRLWSFRLYIAIWTVGQLVAVFCEGKAGLYSSRIITGIGLGAMTVNGPLSIVEIAPAEIRGLLTTWFNVAMGLGLLSSIFCVLGVFEHVADSRLQYQTVFFSPCVFMFLLFVASFFSCESPRWLFLVGRDDEAVRTLVKLRGLSSTDERVRSEVQEIKDHIQREMKDNAGGIIGILKETFTVASNLRRVQQTLVFYGLAQLSGANSITSYFIPILKIVGVSTKTTHSLFLSGMYAFSKFCFTIIASFFFIDAVGRRRSLFVGVTLQMISDIYVGVYVKAHQEGSVSNAASSAAIAWIFIHAFGYCVGLLILPYIFGAELWPNRIRSFGSAMSACFHWLFIYAMQYAFPSLLEETSNWGAFIFFAAWCFVALVYIYLLVPETSGLSVEEIDELFKGPWLNACRHGKRSGIVANLDHERQADLFRDDSKEAEEQREYARTSPSQT